MIDGLVALGLLKFEAPSQETVDSQLAQLQALALLQEPWRLAWVIGNSFRPPPRDGFPSTYADFTATAEAWATRIGTRPLKMLPAIWVRDGVQAEIAVRDYLRGAPVTHRAMRSVTPP
jgi:hypothetical protein